VLFDKITSVYILFEKYILAVEMASPALCQLHRRTLVPFVTYTFVTGRTNDSGTVDHSTVTSFGLV